MLQKNKYLEEEKLKNFEKNVYEKYINVLVYIIFFIAILSLIPANIEDYDIFFHLKYGEMFLKNLTINIDHNIFSWTNSNPNWVYINWLSSIILYLFNLIYPLYGLFVFQTVIIVLVVTFFYKYLNNSKINIKVFLLILLLIFIVMGPSLARIKPESFSILFFTVTVYFYFKGKLSNKFYQKYFPIIILTWVNMHGGFLVGLIFINLVLSYDCIVSYDLKDKNKLNFFKKNIVILLLTNLMSLLNPKGYFYHKNIFLTFFDKTTSVQFKVIDGYNNLFSKLISSPVKEYILFYSTWTSTLLLISIVILLIKYFRQNKFETFFIFGLNIIFYLFSFLYMRNIFYYPVIWFFSFFYIYEKYKINFFHNLNKRSLNVILLLISFVLILKFMIFKSYGVWFGFGIKNLIPYNEIKVLNKIKCSKNIFNDYNIGSYLIYSSFPNHKVFIDSRFGPYKGVVYSDYLSVAAIDNENFTVKFFNKYKFDTAIIKLSEKKLINKFKYNKNWQLFYFDKQAVIYLKKDILEKNYEISKNLNLNSKKFENIKNPITLINIFNFIISYNIEYAKMIKDYYELNIPDYYFFKNKIITQMNDILEQNKVGTKKKGKNEEK